ncbi:MAG: NapC/NirT family cytochrome c [Acidobacteriota bacterium]|nr:NapC/NirT family cytochrome c [Acidobacteriota bacterium]
MPARPSRPFLILLTSHWISMLGAALVTLAGVSWLCVLPVHLGGHVNNPYIGLLIFIAIPIVFFLGLGLIPIGIALAKRNIRAGMAGVENRRTAWRHVVIFCVVATVLNVIIGSQVTYRAVAHMETVQFCGQSCHVMKPEFIAHQRAPHQQVACIACHVGPGASGWIKSKMAGTRQLMGVTFNTFPRPIESAMESNRLTPAVDTCEQCHSREKFSAPRLRVITKFKDDEANSRNQTVLMMLEGGGGFGGIHGAHMGPNIHVRYAAADKKRQTIPWVEYQNAGVVRTYVAGDAKLDAIRALPTYEMQCVDCHNRPAHSFELPDRAVDEAIARGQLSNTLPFIKKTGVELVKASYKSSEEADQKIGAGLSNFYQQKYPEVYGKRTTDIQTAGRALLAIYQRNVFPDLKVEWGTYPNNLGHTDYPGCFRCHDDGHATADKKTITQDCGACHQALAVEETSPEILKTLGIESKP